MALRAAVPIAGMRTHLVLASPAAMAFVAIDRIATFCTLPAGGLLAAVRLTRRARVLATRHEPPKPWSQFAV